MKKFAVLLALLMFIQCANVSTQLAPNVFNSNRKYDIVYVEDMGKDEFGLRTAVIEKMLEMGFVVLGGRTENFSGKDAIVLKIKYDDGYDLWTQYLKSLSIELIDPNSSQIISTIRYRQNHWVSDKKKVRRTMSLLEEQLLKIKK